MADQYLTIATIAADQHMVSRVRACAAQQGADPNVWPYETAFTWAAAPGWAAAWDSAVAGGIPEPGQDPAVITDAQILAQVQAMLSADD